MEPEIQSISGTLTLLCKNFELRNFELLHHLNARHVKYMCTKS
jgi:hypothetical protein